jgi:competence protein ComEA
MMGLSRRQLSIYAALAVIVVAVGVRYLVAAQSGAAPRGISFAALPSTGPAAASPSASPSVTGAAAVVVAYVCGAVRRPGVYTFAQGARITDLIDKAGGATGVAELQTVNLAAVLTDGLQVVVPERGAPGAGAAPADAATSAAAAAPGSATGGALVNLNTATLAELDTLPGVGPSTAQKIIDYRTAQGGFKTVDDLNNVSGIGDVTFAELKDLVTI